MAVLRAASPAGRAALARRGLRRPAHRRRSSTPTTSASVTAFGELLRDRVREATGGLTASVGIGTSKFIAKIASDLDKPDGLVVVAARHRAGPAAPDEGHRDPRRRPGHRRAAAPGRRAHRRRPRVGQRGGAGPAGRPGPRRRALAARPGRRTTGPVEPERETKSVSVEGTYEHRPHRPQADGGPARPGRPATSPSGCASTACPAAPSRIKVRLHDFTTLSRSTTLPAPTDNGAVVARLARTLLADLDTSGGVRLLGVGVSGLADWIQDDLFGDDEPEAEPEPRPSSCPSGPRRTWAPGMDVEHAEHGPGLGLGRPARAWSRSASRPPRPRPGRCGPSAPTTRTWSRVQPRTDPDREPHRVPRPQLRAAAAGRRASTTPTTG